MGQKTGIEWTDATWTPIRARVKADAVQIAEAKGYTSFFRRVDNIAHPIPIFQPGKVGPHCERVSPGCEHCYSETNNGRCLPNNGTGLPFDRRARELVDIFLDEKILAQPLHWRSPKKVFVCSQTDLFGEWVPDEVIDRVFAVMALCPQHTFQVLTKRAGRMMSYLKKSDLRKKIAREANVMMRSDRRAGDSDALSHVFTWGRLKHAEVGEYVNYLAGIADRCWPLPNVWLGVSVEDQKRADERIPLLLQTPAAVRWISAEPLLGPIDLAHIDWVEEMKRDYAQKCEQVKETENEHILRDLLDGVRLCQWEEGRAWRNSLTGAWFDGWDGDSNPEPTHSTIDWVVAGGESGPGARPMHPDWVRSLRDQCQAAGVPFLFKQWGEWAPHPHPPKHGTNTGAGIFLRPDGVWGNQGDFWDGKAQAMDRVRKHVAGRMLDGREWNEYPEVPPCV
jgi:protein gp37